MMDNEMMEARIRRLAEHTAPDQLSGILEACEARKGTVITMNEINNNNKKKKNRFVPIAVAAALVLVCLGGYLGYSYGSAADPGVTGRLTLSQVLYRSHPPVENRIARLEALAASRRVN